MGFIKQFVFNRKRDNFVIYFPCQYIHNLTLSYKLSVQKPFKNKLKSKEYMILFYNLNPLTTEMYLRKI